MLNIPRISIGLSGLGPRGTIFISHIAAYLAFHPTVKELPPFVIHITAFDRHAANDTGCGNAFQTDCDAAANTPLTTDPLHGFEQVDTSLKAFLDPRSHVAEKLDVSKYLSFASSRNPTAAALLKRASFPNGAVDWSRAVLTRGEWGRLQSTRFRRVLNYINNKLPQLQISINPLHEVIGTDLTDPASPALLVKKIGSDKTSLHRFDKVVLAGGWTSRVPVSPDVTPRAYSGTPSHESLHNFLMERGLLVEGKPAEPSEENHKLVFKPGARIAIGGQSLSAFDFVPLMLRYLPGVRSSTAHPSNYVISDKVAEEYKSLFTFVSRTPQSPPPQHNNGCTWYGKVSILSTEEMHTLRLQRNYNCLAVAEDFLHANVAYCVGKVPAEIVLPATSKERMGFFYSQNQAHLAAATEDERRATEVGLVMAGEDAIVFGAGFEANPEAAEHALAAKAPLTRGGRFHWPMFRSSTAEMSRPPIAYTDDAKDFMKRWKRMEFTSIGSPVPIQHWIALLFERGIATHVTASLEDIRPSKHEGKVELGNEMFDALIAPKLLTRNADAVLRSLGSVSTFIPGQPMYGKGRNLIHENGTPIHAFDFGLGGEGVSIEGATVGMQWNDTHSHSSAAQSMACFALQTIIQCAALAVSHSPVSTVHDLYKTILPTNADFNKETAQFESVWREVQQKAVFLKLIKRLAGRDRAKYRAYFANVNDQTMREKFVAQLSPYIAEGYRRECQQIPPFTPVTRDEYESRFIDFTPHQLQKMLKAFVHTNGVKSKLISVGTAHSSFARGSIRSKL